MTLAKTPRGSTTLEEFLASGEFVIKEAFEEFNNLEQFHILALTRDEMIAMQFPQDAMNYKPCTNVIRAYMTMIGCEGCLVGSEIGLLRGRGTAEETIESTSCLMILTLVPDKDPKAEFFDPIRYGGKVSDFSRREMHDACVVGGTIVDLLTPFPASVYEVITVEQVEKGLSEIPAFLRTAK